MSPYRVIVCGNRDFYDREAVARELIRVGGKALVPVIVHGGAAGADTLADAEARRRGFDVEVHPADWTRGRRAGPERNREMAQAGADECIAFWDGLSRGTASMIALAVQAGIRTTIVPWRRP
jgi:hypothetical protein